MTESTLETYPEISSLKKRGYSRPRTTDPGQQNTEWADQLARSAIWISPTRAFGDLDQSNSPNRLVESSKPSNSPVQLVGLVQLIVRASWAEHAVQLAKQASWMEQAVQFAKHVVGPNMQSNSPVRRVGSVSLPSSRPRSSPFGIRSNLLLFHLDRSHRWNFTI
ncbi:hypothetical protein F2Q70_00043765 [Brassica cretica]|uniref:Uncharacterized protein n=1 Tax=Brassica cretica TaxID=69181 RepID=A0A8S9FSH9_BRACR|nr:hypothetical protein F2Q68_00021617 [Brassica cretica]KAF2595018.1 hypothetical protein F2Q70_00043765 [Brassica cretica]